MPLSGIRNDYLIAQEYCFYVIEDFRSATSVKKWLDQHTELYTKVTIAPTGIPVIVDSHFGGDSFEGIQKFGNLYKVVRSIFVDK